MNIKPNSPKRRIRITLPTVQADPFWRYANKPEVVEIPDEQTSDEAQATEAVKRPAAYYFPTNLTQSADRASQAKGLPAVVAGAQPDPTDELMLSLRTMLVDDLLVNSTLTPAGTAGRTAESMIVDVLDNPSKYEIHAAMLSLGNQADYLTKKVRSIFGQLWFPAGMITADAGVDCLRALVEDYVNQACCWNPEHVPAPDRLCCRTPRLEAMLQKYIPPVLLKYPDRTLNLSALHDKFQSEVLGELRAFVHSVVHKQLKGATWKICFVRRAPNGVVIAMGPDFRALDWERRMESGEWE